MKNTIKLIFALAILFSANSSFAQDDVTPQEFMIGTFQYCENYPAAIVMKRKKAVETIMDPRTGKVVVTSKIKWLDENKYELTFVKVKGETNLEKGIVVIVYIKEIKGDEVQVAFTFNDGTKLSNCFKKIN